MSIDREAVAAPTKQRQQELILLVQRETESWPGRMLDEEWSWNDVIEIDKSMTVDEFDWCYQNLDVVRTVTVKLKKRS